MRIHHSPISFPSNDISCEESPYDGCTWTYSKEGSSDYNKAPRVLTEDTFFSNCQWKSCRATSGGSIYVESKKIELTIDQCLFVDSTAEKDYGGAIYVYGINKATITESSFLHCNILSSDNNENGGGGIYLELVSDEVLIRLCTFLDSLVPYDGAGVDMWYCSCKTHNTQTFQDCRFINCKGESDYDSEGGGFLAWDNMYNVGVTNSLFYKCSSTRTGGLEVSLLEPFTSLVTFTFFSENKADFGNDITVGLILPRNEDFLLHSFTTTPSDVIGFYHNGWSTERVNWLPLGDIRYIKDNLADANPTTGNDINNCIDTFTSPS